VLAAVAGNILLSSSRAVLGRVGRLEQRGMNCPQSLRIHFPDYDTDSILSSPNTISVICVTLILLYMKLVYVCELRSAF
jgi:hypothetical protein